MIAIRPYTAQDRPALIALMRDFVGLHREFLGEGGAVTDAEAVQIVQETLDQPQSRLLVAEDTEAGGLAGFARWEEREGAFFGRELFVRPEYRRQGIGGRLQAEVEGQVRQAGGDALFISIVPHNQPMLGFARRRGYDTLNTIELRKELAGEQPRRGRVTLLGLEFRVI